MSNPAKRVALVTGGSRGIGAAIAKRLAADGASVAITYAKDAGAAAAVVKAIELGGGKAIAIQADAANAAAVKDAVERAVATFGRLDVLVNNAGTAIPKPFEEATLEEMDRVIDINIRGILATTQAALKHMHDGGRIIMVGSAVGERAVAPGLVPYAATKGAVKMFTQALSREVGSRGITVNNVQPGPIDTDLNPASGDWAVPQKAATALDRYGRVEEIAAMVAFVAGPESSYITGANLTVDGGMNARRAERRKERTMTTLQNRTALVTGASRGLGRAAALALARAGANVLVHYGRSAQEADSVVDAIRAQGGSANAVQADLGLPDGAALLAKRVRAIAGDRLDVLVLNAGISKAARITDYTVEDFDNLFSTNVRGPFFLVQQLLPVLGEGSNIVVISSLGARTVIGNAGSETPSILAYASTKGALETLVRNWAATLGPRGIRVNAVAPGVIDTDMSNFTKTETGREIALGMQALKRIGKPEDIADVVAFLASDGARWITGASIPVDGGSKL